MWCLLSLHQAQEHCARHLQGSSVEQNSSIKVPQAVDSVSQVVSVVGSTASQQEDTHSQQVAAATLGAIAPAWLRSGKPISEVAAAVVALLPSMLPHRRLPLLTALLAVLPQVSLQLSCTCLVCTSIVCWECCPVPAGRRSAPHMMICMTCIHFPVCRTPSDVWASQPVMQRCHAGLLA